MYIIVFIIFKASMFLKREEAKQVMYQKKMSRSTDESYFHKYLRLFKKNTNGYY